MTHAVSFPTILLLAMLPLTAFVTRAAHESTAHADLGHARDAAFATGVESPRSTGDDDLVFIDGFECNPDGSACSDVVVVDDVHFVPNPDNTGGAIRWLDGATCDCDDASYDFNVYGSPVTLQFFWPDNEGGVSRDSGVTYTVLSSGDVVGPASYFLLTTSPSATEHWRAPAGVDGYLGFWFDNAGIRNYGYTRITTGPSGRPFTIASFAYNRAGDPITIP